MSQKRPLTEELGKLEKIIQKIYNFFSLSKIIIGLMAGRKNASTVGMKKRLRVNLDDAIVLETFSNRIEAEMAAGLLESEGIEAMVMADDAGGTYPMLQFVRGCASWCSKRTRPGPKKSWRPWPRQGTSSSNLSFLTAPFCRAGLKPVLRVISTVTLNFPLEGNMVFQPSPVKSAAPSPYRHLRS